MTELEDLGAIARRLEAQTVTMTDAIVGLTDRLNRLTLGLEVWLALEDGVELGYCRPWDRGAKAWVLAMRQGDRRWPLGRAPRMLRAAGVLAIPALLEALERRAQVALAELEAATREAESFLRAMDEASKR